MDISVASATRQGLTLGPLFLYTERVAAAQGMNPGEAADLLFHLSEQPGNPVTLLVEGRPVPAQRHEILALGDWVVTTVDPSIAVCVAGSREVAVPRLEKADMKLWEGPILEQVDENSKQ
jgi:hypothetical protein